MMGRRIGLLGGSFNPPHVGHLLAAQYVHATQDLDEVWLVPSYRHPFGKALPPFEARVAMCEALCAEASGWLSVSDVERTVDGEGYTVETLERLTASFPHDRFVLILGSDILPDLPRWKQIERVQTLAKMLILYRAGYPALEAVGPPLAMVSSSEVRLRLERGEGCAQWVPRRVLELAERQGLYVPGPSVE